MACVTNDDCECSSVGVKSVDVGVCVLTANANKNSFNTFAQRCLRVYLCIILFSCADSETHIHCALCVCFRNDISPKNFHFSFHYSILLLFLHYQQFNFHAFRTIFAFTVLCGSILALYIWIYICTYILYMVCVCVY